MRLCDCRQLPKAFSRPLDAPPPHPPPSPTPTSTTPTGHIFHPECVDSWLRIDHVCPVCRACVWPPVSLRDSDSIGRALALQLSVHDAAQSRGAAASSGGSGSRRQRQPGAAGAARSTSPVRPMSEVAFDLMLSTVGLSTVTQRMRAVRRARRAARQERRRAAAAAAAAAGLPAEVLVETAAAAASDDASAGPVTAAAATAAATTEQQRS